MKDFLKKRWKFITAFTILNTVILAYDFYSRHVQKTHNKWTFVFLILGQILVELVLIGIYALLKKKKLKTECIFLALYIPLGFLHVFFTPLNQAPDEEGHMIRAYELSNGITEPERDEKGNAVGQLPIEVWDAFYFWQGDDYQYDRTFGQMQKTASGETIKRKYNNTIGYSPVSYAPHILGFWFGRALNVPIVVQFYFARIFSMIAVAILGFFAIKILPKYKEFMLLIILLPRAIQASAMFSGDGLLNATALLFIAMVLRFAFGDKKEIKVRELIPTIIVGSVFSIIKHYTYFPLFLLFLLIPSKKFKHKYTKYVIIAAGLVCTYIGGKILMPLASGAEASDVVSNFLRGFNPVKFSIKSFGTFFGADVIYLWEHFLGSMLNYGGVHTPTQSYSIIMFAFVVILLVRNIEKDTMKMYQKYILWATPIIITVLLYFVAWTQWGTFKDHYRVVAGVGGRYFIPLVPLLPWMLQPKKQYVDKKLDIDYVFMIGIFFNLCIIYCKIVYNL